MIGLLNFLQGSVKFNLKITLDNWVFKLHYFITFGLLLACSFLLSSYQYFGDPIECTPDVGKIDKKMMETYCWVHSTFTVHSENGIEDDIHPGIRDPGTDGSGGKIHYHKYYQFVGLALFLQACFFYLPRLLWLHWEDERVKSLISDLNLAILISDKDTKISKKQVILDYFSSFKHFNNYYGLRYFFCEILNFLNVFAQIIIMDSFLGGEFTTYGSDVLKFIFNPEDRPIDPMSKTFPKVTGCQMKVFGIQGNVESVSAICVLPLNIVNEKIYILLWFWLIALAIFSSLAIIYRALTFIQPFRKFILLSKAKYSDRYEIENICKELGYNDWFLFYLLCKNINPLIFKEIVHELGEKIRFRRVYANDPCDMNENA